MLLGARVHALVLELLLCVGELALLGEHLARQRRAVLVHAVVGHFDGLALARELVLLIVI